MGRKPTGTFSFRRTPSHSHWFTRDWAYIEDIASQIKMPTHWTYMATVFFLRQHPAMMEEFLKWAPENEIEIRKKCMKPEEFEKWKEGEKLRNLALISLQGKQARNRKFADSMPICPVCKVRSTEYHIKSMHPKEYKLWKSQQASVPQVPITVKVTN